MISLDPVYFGYTSCLSREPTLTLQYIHACLNSQANLLFYRVIYCIVGAICLVATGYDFIFIRSAQTSSPAKDEEKHAGNGHIASENNSSDTVALVHADDLKKQQNKPG